MTFKTWLKSVRKALNPNREEAYKNILLLRWADKTYKYSIRIASYLNDYPKELFKYFYELIMLYEPKRAYYDDIKDIKIGINRLDSIFNTIEANIKRIKYLTEEHYPSIRKNINFNHIKLVNVKRMVDSDLIGFVVDVSDRGLPNEYNMNVYGKFYNDSGREEEITNFDKTMLVTPLTDEAKFKSFVEIRNKHFNSLTEQTAEIKMLYEIWEHQLTYLNLKEN